MVEGSYLVSSSKVGANCTNVNLADAWLLHLCKRSPAAKRPAMAPDQQKLGPLKRPVISGGVKTLPRSSSRESARERLLWKLQPKLE